MAERRGSNWLLAWEEHGEMYAIQRALIDATRWLKDLGSTHAQRPDLSYDDWALERLELIADVRDLAHALTSASAVQGIVHQQLGQREVARRLRVSRSAILKWAAEAEHQGLIPGVDPEQENA